MSGEPTAAERLGWLVRTWSRWILAIALLLVAVLVGTSWTLGVFSSSAANPRNVVTSGSMSQHNSAQDSAIMRVTGMVPGTTDEGSATIENVGDAAGHFTLRATEVTDDPGPNGGELSSWLTLSVYGADRDDPLWTGPLADLYLDLGPWEPGEVRTFHFEVEMPEAGAATDNRYQRSQATATYEWDAVQTP